MKKVFFLFYVVCLSLVFPLTNINSYADVKQSEKCIQGTMNLEAQDTEVQTFPGEEIMEESNGQDAVFSQGFSYINAITKNSFSGRYGFEQLSSNGQKTVYALLEDAANQFHNSSEDAFTSTNDDGSKNYYAVSVPVNGIVSASEVGPAVVCFLYDHPEYFWSKGYSYFVRTEDKMVTKVQLQCQAEYENGKIRSQLWGKLQKEISGYMDKIVGVRSDYDKEIILHDALAEKITYAYVPGTKSPESARWAHTIEGVFSEEHYSAVCEGYAKAFQLLLNAAGIENVYVVGKASGTGHAWNQVKIAGDWYNVDPTWNDTGDVKSHKYFNLSDKSFTGSHKAFSSSGAATVGEWCYPTMECTKEEYSYSNIGDYKQGNTHRLLIEKTEGADVKVYNQGVAITSGTAIEENTMLEVVVLPKNTKDYMQISITGNGWKKQFEGVVSAAGISYCFPIVTEDTVAVRIAIPIQKITFNKTNVTMYGYGVRKKLGVNILPTAATEKVFWSSSNSKVIKVKDAVVQSVAKGTAVVTAKSENGKILSSCKVTVKAPYIKINTKTTKIKVGKKMRWKASLVGMNGMIKWSVSNKTKASIGSKNGILKAKKAGTVWVYARTGKYVTKKKIIIKK